MTKTMWFCAKCGEEAPLKPGYLPMDPRYAIVRHHDRDQQGMSDAEKAEAIRAILAAKAEAKKRRPAKRRGLSVHIAPMTSSD
jgi:hypothetical protein